MGLTGHGTWKFRSNPSVHVKHATRATATAAPTAWSTPAAA
jgi:hypothetical protein